MKSLLKIFKVIALTGLIGLTIAFIYLAVGFTYFRVFEPLFRQVEPPGYVEYQLPKIPQLEVGIEMERTQFRVGENITPTPYIVNRGQQAITLFSRGQLLSWRVYDAQNRVVAVRPVFRLVRVRASPWVLEPGKPFDEEWRQWYLPDERWQDRHTFTLEQPGRYRIVASAEICFDGDFAYPVRVYADPIWIEVVGSSK